MNPEPTVVAVSRSGTHTMQKANQPSIKLLENFGIEGDAHAGITVKHRYLVFKKKDAPNLRQVHLVHQELFSELQSTGFNIKPGMIGENITTKGIDLLGLPTNTVLHLGDDAQIRITGLRNPCKQLNGVESGLMKAVVSKDSQGNIIRKTGVMSVVLKSGIVNQGDSIRVAYPSKPFKPLVCV
ncbi:MAG: MOSC domain-containing protein YiiM [bacterium]|jgi:MOSC domain-containing protein YiiM